MSQKHRYRPLYRPAGFATLPADLHWNYVEWPRMMDFARADIPTSKHLYGVIETERQLTPAELATFQIEEVGQ